MPQFEHGKFSSATNSAQVYNEISDSELFQNDLLAALLAKLKICGNSSIADPAAIKSLITGAEALMKQLDPSFIEEEKTNRTLPDIVINLLRSTNPDVVLNAAGAIGSLAGTNDGRRWLLANSTKRSKLLMTLYKLLFSNNKWIVSNAALVLARLSIADEGIHLILESEVAQNIIQQLINLLGKNESGSGMNAAFAIGRMLEDADGRNILLHSCDLKNLTIGLSDMLASSTQKNPDMALCKDACFCITSLASNLQGNLWMAKNSLFLYGDSVILNFGHKPERVREKRNVGIIGSLLHIMKSNDAEAPWFATVALRTFASFSHGYLALRQFNEVWEALQSASCSDSTSDLYTEMTLLKSILCPLKRPPIPYVDSLVGNEYIIKWEPTDRKLPISIFYELFIQTETTSARLVYRGLQCNTEINNLKTGTTYYVKLRLTSEVDTSEFSEFLVLKTDPIVIQPPHSLKATAVTTNQVKVTWEPPQSDDCSVRNYQISLNGKEVRTTSETSTILSGLEPMGNYEIQVTSVKGNKQSDPAGIKVTTANSGRHGPSKPKVISVGRSEVVVSWQPPEEPLGRITRYEVYINDKKIPAYMGTETSCHIRGLQPGTKYNFKVIMLGSNGKCGSEPTLKKTGRDEYSNPRRTPLYETPRRLVFSQPKRAPLSKTKTPKKSNRRSSSLRLNKRPIIVEKLSHRSARNSPTDKAYENQLPANKLIGVKKRRHQFEFGPSPSYSPKNIDNNADNRRNFPIQQQAKIRKKKDPLLVTSISEVPASLPTGLETKRSPMLFTPSRQVVGVKKHVSQQKNNAINCRTLPPQRQLSAPESGRTSSTKMQSIPTDNTGDNIVIRRRKSMPNKVKIGDSSRTPGSLTELRHTEYARLRSASSSLLNQIRTNNLADPWLLSNIGTDSNHKQVTGILPSPFIPPPRDLWKYATGHCENFKPTTTSKSPQKFSNKVTAIKRRS